MIQICNSKITMIELDYGVDPLHFSCIVLILPFMTDLRSVEEPVYYAYTVSHHPSSDLFEESRYKLIYSEKKLPEQYTVFLEGHLYFPKFVNLGKLTTAHIELFQTCVDKTSSDSELREDAACDMDVWNFTFSYFQIGSKRMSEEGAHSAYFLPDQEYMFLAFPLWEVFSIPGGENNVEDDILVVKTWSKENSRFVLEVASEICNKTRRSLGRFIWTTIKNAVLGTSTTRTSLTSRACTKFVLFFCVIK